MCLLPMKEAISTLWSKFLNGKHWANPKKKHRLEPQDGISRGRFWASDASLMKERMPLAEEKIVALLRPSDTSLAEEKVLSPRDTQA